MKKFVMLVLALVLCMNMVAFSAVAETAYNDLPFKTVDLEELDPDYYAQLLEAEIYNYKMVRNYPTLFEEEAWDLAQTSGNLLLTMDPANLTDEEKATIAAARDAVAALAKAQLKPFEGIDGEVLYIWGDDMPVTTENVEAGFTVDSYDNADFRPFLVPYLVSDQSLGQGHADRSLRRRQHHPKQPQRSLSRCSCLPGSGLQLFCAATARGALQQ